MTGASLISSGIWAPGISQLFETVSWEILVFTAAIDYSFMTVGAAVKKMIQESHDGFKPEPTHLC